jgi:hypothetical protein
MLWWLPMWVPIATVGGTAAIAIVLYALLSTGIGISP